ncbi:hypothetical protein TI03_04270, partial [Achromatium sp. WMS1]
VHRRYKQLKEKGLNVNLTELTATMHTRDERDRTRSMAPGRILVIVWLCSNNSSKLSVICV